MFRRSTCRMTRYLAYTVLLAAVAAWLGFCGEYFYMVAAIVLLVVLFAAVMRLYRDGTRKITFLFNAIENGDYAFRFTEPSRKRADDTFNQMLNYVKGLLEKARDEVMEKERYYELILNHTETGFVVVNEKGNIHQVNNRALELLHIPVLTHINHLQRTDASLPGIFETLENGESRSIRFNTDKGIVHLSLQASELIIRGNRLRIIAVNNIEHELEENEIESWINLTRVLTHEIMNSISPVTSLSETLLEMHGNRNDDMGRGLEAINSTTRGLTSFVRSYRSFTHIPEPRPQLFYIRPFLERLLLLMSAEFSEKSIETRIDISQDDLILHADENLISQVVLNLVKNAVSAIGERPGGRIWFDVYCDENENVIVETGNNGKPIPANEAEQIFIPFFTTKTNGSGIGLSISRRIMRLHKGSIKLKHTNDAETVFILTFR